MTANNDSRWRRLLIAIPMFGAMAVVGGCSTITGMAGGGDMNLIYIQAASTDELLTQKYEVAVKPVCTQNTSEKTTYSCTGQTADGKEIKVQVTGAAASNPNPTNTTTAMVLMVGEKEIFNGPMYPVMVSNLEATK